MRNKFLTLIICIAVFNFISCSDNNLPSEPIKIVKEGASISPELGGPNEQNQVYVDLSTNTTTSIKRDSWDLGFYSGDDFRVTINGAIAMATAQLSTANIDAITSVDEEVKDLQAKAVVGSAGSNIYVDSPDGNIKETAMNEVSINDSENKVYLVNLGFNVGTDVPATGSIDISGDPRGWKKVRVLRRGDKYVLQYADLDATTHVEKVIPKKNGFNFTFFSFDKEAVVDVEPEKTDWDLNFTVSNKVLDFGGGVLGAYSFSDFVTSNTKSNVGIYMINTDEEKELSYDAFNLSNVVEANFVYNDQNIIGSSWRNVFSKKVKSNLFYIVNDTDGNIYKLQFLALLNEAGERGSPEFVYSLL